MKTYRVNEIFYSIQGEGRWTGTAVVFLRFSGCNLRCAFCDTSHQSGEELTLEQIVTEARLVSQNSVVMVITGGEPMLQLDRALTQALRSHWRLHLETNGTICVPEDFVDWITVSPKQGQPWVQRKGDELKVVYQGQDLEQYLVDSAFDYLYLQPCSMKNAEETVQAVKEHPEWRLSIQTHKLLKIR